MTALQGLHGVVSDGLHLGDGADGCGTVGNLRAQLRRLLSLLDAGDVVTVTRLDRLAGPTYLGRAQGGVAH